MPKICKSAGKNFCTQYDHMGQLERYYVLWTFIWFGLEENTIWGRRDQYSIIWQTKHRKDETKTGHQGIM